MYYERKVGHFREGNVNYVGRWMVVIFRARLMIVCDHNTQQIFPTITILTLNIKLSTDTL